ncbi:MAG: hypothetical protein EB078_08130 [Proteobacteria bacterium]|nr:hypothetical protein [Pseudomonadota bacterium]NDD04858.1 hypothetical protein [Pseudomonadota bacterium]
MLKLSEPIGDERPARILGTVEKPAPENSPSRFAIIGRYVFEPEIFDCLSRTPKGAGGEIQLTDGMNQLCEKGGLFALKIKAARYDVGNQFFYLKAQIDEALRRPELASPLKEYLKTL